MKHLISQNERKSEIINLSTKYSVLTKFTSFVAIEDRKSNTQKKASLQIEELIAAESVDELHDIPWRTVCNTISMKLEVVIFALRCLR